MLKQPNEILTTLELASAYLMQARQQLIRCDSSSAQTEPTLLRVAGLLEALKVSSPSATTMTAADKQTLVRALSQINTYAARAQMLLDSAASFYCGAALAGPVVAETYNPDGDWQTIYPADQICLNA